MVPSLEKRWNTRPPADRSFAVSRNRTLSYTDYRHTSSERGVVPIEPQITRVRPVCFQIETSEDGFQHVYSQSGDIRHNNGLRNADVCDKQFYGTYDRLANRMRRLCSLWFDLWHGTIHYERCHCL